MNLDCCLIPYPKINRKWIKVLNLRPKTIQLIEENMGHGTKVHYTGFGNAFLDRTPKALVKKKTTVKIRLHEN